MKKKISAIFILKLKKSGKLMPHSNIRTVCCLKIALLQKLNSLTVLYKQG